MLKMSRKRTIHRNRRPAVLENLHFMATGIDHRFNSQNHTHFKQQSLALWAIIRDLRLFVKALPIP